ncbi:glycosyltransferase family 2 protein [Loktanella sp. 5RATIMAR09]|uniref:glycosyltransferase family 2 protein n=1 Tax=Loktanella sp. 5RATIMAR09 TaxID=1225655 RepID=UPI0006EB5DAD|nr:glycosyltransferase family 2 protein [Loktanella sp. 5RATIMAR09]
MTVSHSVVIPTKDRPEMLRRAVASALSGLARDGEVVVVDDHSSIAAQSTLHDLQTTYLRIISLPQGASGVSAARNAGIKHARGDVIFFLDDDDELTRDYCHRVLSRAVANCDFGFSAYLQVFDADKAVKAGSIRFAEGEIPADAPLRKKLCGFGMGFWIRRKIALQVGEIALDLSINEDTDYLCRLIAARKRGWYSAEPGVVLHHHSGHAAGLEHLTDRTSDDERARCMRVVCERYPQMVAHLGRGYIRHCLKTGTLDDASHFIRRQDNWRVRSGLRLFAVSKWLAYRLTRPAPKPLINDFKHVLRILGLPRSPL